MEVLNATDLKPLTVHRPTISIDRKTTPKKLFSFKFPKPTIPNAVSTLSVSLSRALVLLSSVAGATAAKALTYEEALNQSMSSSSVFGGSDGFDIGGFIDRLVRFGSENPPVIAGGAAVVALPLILGQIFKNPKPYGVESVKSAYAKISEDPEAQLLDIREGKEFKESGSPDIRGLKKKAVSITYRGDDKVGFLKKLELKFKDPGSTTLFIIDKFDGNSELVAELVTANGFKAAFAIKDGAEGTRGWKNSGLPWLSPKKGLSFDVSELKDALSGALGESTDGLPATLGLAAVTGLGVLAFSEIETVLQLLGSAALIQFVTKKLLFAESRKVTLQQVDEFLNTKVAPKELVDELKMIGKAILPAPTNAKASLPAPAEAISDTTPTTTDSSPVVSTETKVEAVAESPQEINSVPKPEIKTESPPATSRPLSPYPYYADFKPPSSPSPSQP
ncbi:hypothetical protein QJS10_CPB20g02043 [Acorus calamus]|uniref:Protein THYLAKOID RHODANESE-LIKE, chloroplastic n=1 Tax=Acorus calamus TaxID=4465 RepID=A0AAV9C893_ACOCL|nr:hypothetical protein QJS10_CPB20g02043 [Acorus calamus]